MLLSGDHFATEFYSIFQAVSSEVVLSRKIAVYTFQQRIGFAFLCAKLAIGSAREIGSHPGLYGLDRCWVTASRSIVVKTNQLSLGIFSAADALNQLLYFLLAHGDTLKCPT